MRKRTLTIIAAIFIAVAITNSLWLFNHERVHLLHIEEVCAIVEETNSSIVETQNALLDSITVLNSKIDSLENINIDQDKHISFVEKKTNIAIRDNYEQAEDIFRLHRWHWEAIDSTKTVK